MKKILPFFSYVFHPLFIPLYAVFACFTLNETFLATAEKSLIVIQVIIITILIPIAFFFLLRSLGKIDNIMASNLNQRKAPLVMQAILIFILTRNSVTLERIPELYFFFISAFLSTAAALLFLFSRIKASLHMLGMGSLVFFVIGLSFHNQINLLNTVAFLLVMTGMVASSRLFMRAHNYTELIIGFLAGMLPQMVLWQLWL